MIFEIFELTITIADLSLILILLISGVLAFFRGFITEILAIASWVGATISTLSLFKPIQPFTREIIPISLAADVITGIVIFLISLLLISLITHSIANLIRGKSLSIYDRCLGFIYGILRGVFLISFLQLLSVQVIPLNEHPDWVKKSISLPYVTYVSDFLLILVPNNLIDES